MATTMQTIAGTSTGAAALTLAGQSAPASAPLVKSFISKPGHRGSTGTGHKASLGGPGGPGGFPGFSGLGFPGGGFPGGSAPGGGGGPPGGGGPAGGGGRGDKLGGNPPPEFDGDCSYVNHFMNKFNLYRLANMEAIQMRVLMKCVALLLSFIKAPNIDDWVQQRTNEILDQFNQTGDQLDEIYWTSLGQQFMDTF